MWYCGALAGAPARATPARLLRLRPLRPDAVLVPLRWPVSHSLVTIYYPGGQVWEKQLGSASCSLGLHHQALVISSSVEGP